MLSFDFVSCLTLVTVAAVVVVAAAVVVVVVVGGGGVVVIVFVEYCVVFVMFVVGHL